MIPKETKDWLKKHNKGDLQECTWEEIKEALAASGRGCPLADEHSRECIREEIMGLKDWNPIKAMGVGEKKPMTLEEIIIHIWDMAIASVTPGKTPYEANVVRQDTLKWASFELNERAEIALKAGREGVVDWLIENEDNEGIKAMFYFCVNKERLLAQLKEWGFLVELGPAKLDISLEESDGKGGK